MNINRKSSKEKAKFDNKDRLVPIVLDIGMLDIICKFVMSDSLFVKRHHLINVKTFINMIDRSTYANDIEKVKRFTFIKYALQSKTELHIFNTPLVFEFVQSKMPEKIDFFDLNTVAPLSKEELNLVNDMVEESLKYSFMFMASDEALDILNRLRTTDYRYRGDIVREWEDFIDRNKNDFRKVRTDSMTDMTFSLKEGKFENAVTDTYNTVTSPSRRLYCAMQGLNQMTGGFENGRVYMLFGTTGVGKSVTLLNLAYQMKKANTNYKTKDPTKTPAIVILTMENTVVETITRLFNLACNDNSSMANYTLEEVLHKLRTEGELYINNESPIDIIIKYKANRSINTGYLYGLVDDIEDEGYEVICLIQDHVKRIRSVENIQDLRIELGEVVNELRVFASVKDIPVISNSHLNRDAAKVMDSAMEGNKADMTRMLGKANVGESLLMLDNLDMGIIINKEYDKDMNCYIVFSTIKMREKSERTYIAQPFVAGSTIRLAEDLDSPVPLFKESLHTSANLVNNTRKNVKRSSYSDIGDLDDMFKKDKKDNIFQGPAKYDSEKMKLPIDDENEEEEYDGSYIPVALGGPNQAYLERRAEELPVTESKEAIRFMINYTSINNTEKKNAIYFLNN